MLLFLGAGASAPFGIPTMAGFIDLLDKEIGDSAFYQDLKVTFKDNCDLEALMTVIEDLSKSPQDLFNVISPQTALFLLQKEKRDLDNYLKEDSSRKKASELLTKVKAIIRRECNKAIDKESRIIEVYDDFFTFLAKTTNEIQFEPRWNNTQIGRSPNNTTFPSDLRIFTTNYDQCIETYFRRREVNFWRGIKQQYGESIFDVNSYDSNEASNMLCKIYKLHGSVDLFEKGGRIRRFEVPRTEEPFLIKEYGKESMRWPVEFGGYRHIIESPYLDLFRRLRDTATRKKWWIVIGFSFRDRTICSILNDVVRLMPRIEHPRIFLLNRRALPVIERLRDWNYQALVDTMSPVEAEFGSGDFTAKLRQAFADRNLIKEMHVSFGKVPK